MSYPGPLFHSTLVVSRQPGAPSLHHDTSIEWTLPPSPIEDCPPGLEYLTQIDCLLVEQCTSLLETFIGWEVSNKYVVSNGAGQQAYFAFEESECCQRQCCGAHRGYTIHVVDNFRREVMRISRPYKGWTYSCLAMFGGCAAETIIEAPPGNVIGVVREEFGCTSKNFVVRDASESIDIFQIEGPNMCGWTYNCNCCADKVFEIFTTRSNHPIGVIRKKWSDFFTEAYTDSDKFSVEFPLDLNPRMKAALLGATFLIDFLCFEDGQKLGQNLKAPVDNALHSGFPGPSVARV